MNDSGCPDPWGLDKVALASEQGYGALKGIRVLDFGQYVAGPLLGMLLADQGANVIKVERPGGDPARSATAFSVWNRGKRSIVLDLKSAVGRSAAIEMLRDADVVIENFSPGVANRLGVGYEAATSLNPNVVYCSLPGFGEHTPWQNHPAWDPLIAAMSGVYSSIFAVDLFREGSESALYTPLLLPSTFGAIVASGAVTAALIARDRFHIGQHVTVPLHNAMLAVLGRVLARIDGTPEPFPQWARFLPMMDQYRCADGRWLQNHGRSARFVRSFLTVAGRPDWIDEAISGLERAKPGDKIDKKWRARFEKIFAERASWEWEELINAAEGCCTVCRSVEEWLTNPHALASGQVIEVQDEFLGKMKQPGLSVRLSRTPGRVRSAAPALGAHTTEIMSRVPSSSERPVNPSVTENVPAPLDGIRVLDLCILLAGPTCGRVLAEFGADVIKIDDPARRTDRYHVVEVNRGKRSLALNLKTEAGREVFWRLVETADVVVENYRYGKLEKLGLGYDDVVKRKPDIVYASLNAYGFGGPWANRPGWDQNAQAASGIQIRHGGRQAKPKLITYAIDDYGGGFLAAYGVLLALYERLSSRAGQKVETSLVQAACLLQSRYFYDYPNYQRAEPEGPELLGECALSRLYLAADDWLYLHGPDENSWSRFTSKQEFATLATDPSFTDAAARRTNDNPLSTVIADIIKTRPRQYWLDELGSAGIGVAPRLATADLAEYPEPISGSGIMVRREAPGIGLVENVGPAPVLSATPALVGRPATLHGADTETILVELGYGPAAISAMKTAGVVVQA